MWGNKNAVYLVLISQGANLRQLGHVQVLALELPLRQPGHLGEHEVKKRKKKSHQLLAQNLREGRIGSARGDAVVSAQQHRQQCYKR